jgi:integrase/recombinase XerD
MPNISIRLRIARTLKNGSHPICLQVTWGKQTRYKTIKGYSCKPQSWDFDEHCFLHSERKNGEMQEYLKKARRVVDYMEDWDYKRWVKELDKTQEKNKVDSKKLIGYCREIEQDLIKTKQIGYSQNFKALASFLEKCFKKDIRLTDFGEQELKEIIKVLDEREMKGYSYIKYLKIVLCNAISKGIIKGEQCPIKSNFSPTGYDINKRNKKESKHIKKNRIKDLLEHEKELVVQYYLTADIPLTQKKHLAYWVLSYRLFGVNFKDIVFMKWEDIINGSWDYSRSKTGIGSDTVKPVDDLCMKILKEYDTGGKYILYVMNGYDHDLILAQKRRHNYKSNLRRSLQQLSKKIFDDGRHITLYTTRYTAPTLALEKSVDLKTVMTLMDHANIKTTSGYIGRVRERQKLKEAMSVL